MTAHLAPALTTCVAHEQRRHMPLPSLCELTDDEALALVLAAARRCSAGTALATNVSTTDGNNDL